MGNIGCFCHRPVAQKNKIINYQPNLRVDIVEKPQITTPYENGPFVNSTNNHNYASLKVNEDFVEEYPITPELQSTVESSYSRMKKRPSFNYSSIGNEHDSVFTPESERFSTNSQLNEYGNHVYEFLFKEFLKAVYPINNEIINEMKKYNLLFEDDANSLLKLPFDKSKTEFFFNKFVFSETNICKLSTFLFVIINEKSSLFYNLQKSEKILSSVIDQIYYVINFISLLQNSTDETERIKSMIYNSSLINIHYKKENDIIKPENHQIQFVDIHLNDLNLPNQFWYSFSKINEDFQCCQEIIICSCNLNGEDTYNLIQGLKSLKVLKKLDISTNPITDIGLKHIQSLFQLKNGIETLDLTCCSLTATGIEEFLDVLLQNSLKFHLKSLSLSHNDLENMSENSISILTKLPLISLELKLTNMKYQKALYESLKLNYSLRQLNMSMNKLQNKDITYLASGLAYNNNLKSISLAMIGLSKSDCLTINNALLMNKSLTSIDLSDNAIGDEGVEILKDILTMKRTLREVYLKRCNISLHGILILLRQASEPDCHLQVLDLCFNRCPRMSMIIETKELVNKIYDVMRQIGLVKSIRISLWGTLDLSLPL